MMRLRLASLSALLLSTALLSGCGAPKDAARVRVFLPPGASFKVMTDSLVARGVVQHRTWFTLLARTGRFDRRLRAGMYEFAQGSSAWEVLHSLTRGNEVQLRFTVPEAETIVDIAAAAERDLRITRDSVLVAARDPALMQEFGVEGPSMEGYLQPETYYVSTLITGRQLVREMAKLFQASWNPAWDVRADHAGLTRQELVTLASLVEGEARVPEDRPLVAAVYLNRLKLKMPLQADPTVQYGIQLATGQRKTRLLLSDYKFDSPYNTYLHPGLPPGPVGAPSRASIEAVLAPAQVPYLYFVAGDSGRHVFSRSYQEHLRSIARIRQGR